MTILGIDMGWSKSVSCLIDGASNQRRYETIGTNRASFETLITRLHPDRVVIEAGPMAGWVHDLCRRLKQELLVLNTNDEAWQWSKVKRKSDRSDALKIARMAMLDGISRAVHVPEHAVRQWRQLIAYRTKLVNQTVAIRNRLRSVLLQEDRRLPGGKKAWTGLEFEELKALGKPLEECSMEELWRGELDIELRHLEQIQAHVAAVEKRLDAIGSASPRVKRLKQLPGVGNRCAEALVAMIDEPARFGRAREVGAYLGLTPRKFQSGSMDRDGHISRCGNALMRKLLVQSAWTGKRSCEALELIYQKVKRQSPKRKKQAIVAAARHLGIWAWAMDRDQVDFTPPAASKALAELRAKQARQMAEGRSSRKMKRRRGAWAAEQEREAERNETAEMATTV